MAWERYINVCHPEKKTKMDTSKRKIYIAITGFVLILPVAAIIEGLVTTYIMHGRPMYVFQSFQKGCF